MKGTAVIMGAVFAIALAVLIGTRMSADALGVLVGVICGVLASVPTSLVLVWALVRRLQGQSQEPTRHSIGNPGYPPVVVVNPGAGYGLPGYGPSMTTPSLPLPGGPRSFKVVGEEETMLDNAGRVFPGLAED
ncbi:MAG: hypothetical protein Kow0063_17990 [Anaerolineae bacterium]